MLQTVYRPVLGEEKNTNRVFYDWYAGQQGYIFEPFTRLCHAKRVGSGCMGQKNAILLGYGMEIQNGTELNAKGIKW